MKNKDSSAEEIEDAGSHPLKVIGLINDGDADRVPQWTKEEEKKLVRTIDWRVFPMLCTIFGLSLLDRTNISSAYIAGLGADIQLSQGIWLIRNPIEPRHPPYWCQGVAELPDCIMGRLCPRDGLFFPGAVFIIGSWYRQYETATRVSLFYMAALIASGFGPILAYVFSLIRVGDGIYTQGWRWIFIIEGIATIVAGIAAAFFLVEFPDRASWLTPRQKQIAIARLSVDKSEKEYKHPSFKEAMVMIWDWKIIIFSIQYFIAASSVYSIAYFKTIILREGMGFSYALSQILSSPPYVFAVIMSLVMAWLSDKYKIRWAILVTQSLSAVVGLLITLYSGPPGVRYFGLFIAVFGTQANIPGTLSYGQSQIPTVEKRGVIAAAMISVGAAGGIAGSTIFRTQDAPRYLPGMWATIAMQMLYTVVTLVFSFYLRRQNRLVDEGKRGDLEGVSGFRYAP
ncbi:major facilitator superfamily domain-containing protein [Aspergillus pseudotamarii]|uniref:Major facilitator superfamily domain-containing protein n=1 Tax=Aspergillus pseudotamarii TaxID=132259 RepID=A0A5N6SS79_ASPPS|nr:major facilitator superfamily domain-containing protein [Aspergillus pseudotamarii]KAE8137472.1 major facilitator superfamily domain-containing protein [Aspergillus pseudotamarii]